MIDLHTHTTESDGTLSPDQLVEEARRRGITVLSITDHDTLSGYDLASKAASYGGIELLCGVEVSGRYQRESVHLLAYFPNGCSDRMRLWIREMQGSRQERNALLARRLQENGIAVSLEEAE